MSTTPRAWASVIGASLGLIALLTALIAAFTWPLSELEPRELPIAVAGPPQAVAGLEQQLAAKAGQDAFDLTRVADRAAAVEAVRDREVYAALVVGPTGNELVTASAASPAVARMLTEQVSEQVPGVTVTDAVPLPEGDPQGIIFGAGALPLAIGGIVVGAVTSMALRRTRERVVTALLVALGAGLAMTGVLDGWLDVLGGHGWANAGVIALGLLAVALPIVGLRHVLGPAGIAVMGLLVLLVGNPLSGVTSAPELVPFGRFGQLLPPGAVGTALRGTAYFDGAGVALPVAVLASWAVAGLVLTLIPAREGAGRDAEAPAA